MTKTVLSTRSAPQRHWVGNGFPVHGLFGYDAGAAQRSPFLLLDYGAPTRFEPTTERRGVGEHPHRGFETVTIVYAGEVEHRDSTGQGGVIGPGDVQWMPARHKMAPPGYQAILGADIPAEPLPGGAGEVRVIAGRCGAAQGPARTFTPMNVWDVRLAPGPSVALDQPEGWACLLVVLAGSVRLGDGTELKAAQMATLSTSGSALAVVADAPAKLLLLAGEPLNEAVVGYGPFVMNSRDEIVQAIEDFNAGRFGQM